MRTDIDLRCGDALELLRGTPDGFADSIVTDPPYGLSFMGARWDYDVPSVHVWQAALRVIKPGAYLLAFAGTRTQHRMACNIEDAGFEIRDTIGWMYAQGMPKSGGLKPAWEPIIVARAPGKPVKINIELCRTEGGRYPANLIHDGSDEVKALFPANNPGCKPHRVKSGDESVARLQEKGWGFAGSDKIAGYDDGDDLSAARFFYCTKPNKRDRNEGTANGNNHLTVKPTDLMRYLVRLVTPAGGRTLDPFMGSGSTGKAAALEGFHFTGFDLDPANVELARERINFAAGGAQ